MQAADAKRAAMLVEALDNLDALKRAGWRKAADTAFSLQVVSGPVQVLSATEGMYNVGSIVEARIDLPIDFADFMIPHCEAAIRAELERLDVTFPQPEESQNAKGSPPDL